MRHSGQGKGWLAPALQANFLMVTKVKDRPYFFLSSVFGCLFTRHFKLSLSSLVMMTKK